MLEVEDDRHVELLPVVRHEKVVAHERAVELLARVGLADAPDTLIKNIGVGKQQLVEIAKALSKDVKLLILDEPTAALNDSDSEHLLGLLRRLKERGITSIMISHKLNEITAISDRVTVIRDGKTVETLSLHAGEVTQERIIRGMVGRDLESFYPDRESHPGEEVLRVQLIGLRDDGLGQVHRIISSSVVRSATGRPLTAWR